MTPEYDHVVQTVNDYLSDQEGLAAGAVQRLGAGWGGTVGGLLHRDMARGERVTRFENVVEEQLGLDLDLSSSVVTPGEGASLLRAPSVTQIPW